VITYRPLFVLRRELHSGLSPILAELSMMD
jgi:hypothetical protein